VAQNLLYDGRLLNKSYDPHCIAALGTFQRIDLKNGLYKRRPGHAAFPAKRRIRFRLAADVTLATFFVSHLTPFGSATGTVVNASTLETEGIAAATTGEASASCVRLLPVAVSAYIEQLV
jgi:hypothetical protein